MTLPQTRLTAAVLWLMNFLLAIPLVIYATGTFYTRLAYDDFCSAVVARRFGLMSAVSWWYTQMNGRFAAFTVNSATTLVGAPVASLLVISFLCLWWSALFSLLWSALRSRPYRALQAAICSSALIACVLTSLPYPSTALYWYTGTSMYLPAVALFTAYVRYVTRPVDTAAAPRSEMAGLLICFVLPFLVAGASDIGGFVQTLILGVALVVSLRLPIISRVRRVRLLIGLLGSGIGLAMVLLSPGNARRASLFPKPDIGKVVSIVASSPGAPFVVSVGNSPLAIVIVFLIPFTAGYYAPEKNTLPQRKAARVSILIIFVVACVLIAACFAPVAYFLSAGLVEHAWIIPMTIGLSALGLISYQCGLAFRPAQVTASGLSRLALPGAMVLLTVFGLLTISSAFSTVRRQQIYAAAWDSRDVDARAKVAGEPVSPESAVFVNPYTYPWPAADARPLVLDSLRSVSPFKWEIEATPNIVANVCVAHFYHVAAVIAAPEASTGQ